MKRQPRYEKVKRNAEGRAKELFKPLPEDIKKELEKDSTLGSPQNLIDRIDEEE
ncbi:hypothetical protein P3339_10200 [Microbulbifer sp. MLAF003]|uniref:hypothetical protein n=1 Tax=Microbulbifer sp. MLAF003 TaxID=3032582 RepID=UPI0024ADDDD8|nr:hypothetical protein [Microbulbifer sp. MLAF003]WHI53099.1 hypothetical protein P3339_10200 [Microbulbifer sp. MLAF003]